MFAPPPLPSFSNPFADADELEISRISLTPEAGSAFEFPYNPTKFSLDRKVSWEDSKAMKEPYGILNFTGGSSDTVTFTTLLDVTEKDDDTATIHDDVVKLYKLTETSEKDNNYKRPPILTMAWGDKFKFVGVITALKVDYTMFSADGRPLRADVTLTLMGRTFATSATPATFFAPVTKA